MPAVLVRVLMLSSIQELPGLREMAKRFGPALGTGNFSSLCPALSQDNLLLLVQAMARRLGSRCPAEGAGGPTPIVAVDSMALTLGNKTGAACQALNNQTRGGGVLWAFWLQCAPGHLPLDVLHVMRGAWSDAKLIRLARLRAHGPLYLFDRSFYAIDLIARWLSEGVHFIVRAQRNKVFLEPEAPGGVVGPARQVGEIEVLRDEIGLLGKAGRRGERPRVRLVWARLRNKHDEELILISDRCTWSAERLLQAYGWRQKIEQFHRWIKQGLGLAHLYNFQPVGLEVQLWTTLLLVLLACLALGHKQAMATLGLLDLALKQLRLSLGLPATRWRPNTPPARRTFGSKAKGGEACAPAC